MQSKRSALQLRIIYILLSLLLLAIEVIIAVFVDDSLIRPYVGDILVVILLYCFARIFIPTGVRFLPLFIFIFACTIEFMQYLNIVEMLGLTGNKLARTIIGTSFDWKDIACYAVGCTITVIIQGILARKK